MSLDKYFREEMAYLRELGQEFSADYPHLHHFLSEQSADPDVERLLEGFAFLTGSLRAKIEDEFPELTHGLLTMLWPNYLRPVPSMTIIEYSSNENTVTEATCVTRHTALFSAPIENEECQFRTCRDNWVFPMIISELNAQNSNEKGLLDITFSSTQGLILPQLGLEHLRLYLGDDPYIGQQLYLWFCHHFTGAQLLYADNTLPLPGLRISPVGFKRDEAMLPYPTNAFAGYCILQEYLCFPEAFMFLDLTGFGTLPDDQQPTTFTLRFHFDRPLPPDITLREKNIRLNCTPAINLFERDSEPVMMDGKESAYALLASQSAPQHFEIFSVDTVESWKGEAHQLAAARARGGIRTFTPFESFQHQIEYAQGRTALYYRLRIKDSRLKRGVDHWISFVRGDESSILLEGETVSARLTCTNRNLPTLLNVGDITRAAAKNPSFASFRNITRPSMPLSPLMDGSLHWMLISNMSLNYLSLLSKEALCQILRFYDFPAIYNRQAARQSQKRIAGIEQIETKPVDRLFKGMPVRGLASTLYLRQSAFDSEGDLYMFSNVLAHFFALYASVNAFHELSVINLDNQERYLWPMQIGQHPLM